LNASASCAIRWASSASVCSKSSCTGAEKVTQQRGDRRGRDVLEDEALAGFGERKLRLT
jgi:hypothetical protein